MSVTKYELKDSQITRLYNHTKDGGKIKSATLCVIDQTNIKRIEIEFYNMGKETIYPSEDTLDYIVNGVHVERENNGSC